MSAVTAYLSADNHRRAGAAPAPRADGEAVLFHDAQTILARHTRDSVGMCAGCRTMWNRLAPYPCTQAAWAQAVLGRAPTAETMAALGLRTA